MQPDFSCFLSRGSRGQELTLQIFSIMLRSAGQMFFALWLFLTRKLMKRMACRPYSLMPVAIGVGLVLSLNNCTTPQPVDRSGAFSGVRASALKFSWPGSLPSNQPMVPAILWPLPDRHRAGPLPPPIIRMPSASFAPLTRSQPKSGKKGVQFRARKNIIKF